MLPSPFLLLLLATTASAVKSNHTKIAQLHRSGDNDKRAINAGWSYGSQKIRGVNLGSWLLTEPFINPSLYDATNNPDIVDEYTFCLYQDKNVAAAALKKHWDSWITEDDFKQIAQAGLNHVRIPIGFWAYDISGGEPYIQGQAEYLEKGIEWARRYGIKVMIDLHGAPGSQNGFDNSGKRGAAEWHLDWYNVHRTKNVIAQLSRQYSDPKYYQVVTALALLNEPAGFVSPDMLATTRQFWYDGYGAARWPWGSEDKSGLIIVIHDAFQPINTWDNFMPSPAFEGVVLDTHNYQVFSDDENARNWDQHLQFTCTYADNYSRSDLWLVVGEWSLASTDCARWLNGVGRGARYDGSYDGSRYVASCDGKSGDGSSFSREYKEFMRKYWDIQTQTFEENGQGWIMWTWKTESVADWSYKAGLEGGWIPYDPSQHIVSLREICG